MTIKFLSENVFNLTNSSYFGRQLTLDEIAGVFHCKQQFIESINERDEEKFKRSISAERFNPVNKSPLGLLFVYLIEEEMFDFAEIIFISERYWSNRLLGRTNEAMEANPKFVRFLVNLIYDSKAVDGYFFDSGFELLQQLINCPVLARELARDITGEKVEKLERCELLSSEIGVQAYKQGRKEAGRCIGSALIRGRYYVSDELVKQMVGNGDWELVVGRLACRSVEVIEAALAGNNADVGDLVGRGESLGYLIDQALRSGSARVVEFLVNKYESSRPEAGGRDSLLGADGRTGGAHCGGCAEDEFVCSAIKYGNLDVAEYLMNEDLKESQISKIFVAACGGGYLSLAKLFSGDVRDEGRIEEALIAAAQGPNANVVEYIVRTFPQIDVNARSSEGKTALEYACMRGNTRSVGVLLDAGADVNVVTEAGADDCYSDCCSDCQARTMRTRAIDTNILSLRNIETVDYDKDWRKPRALLGPMGMMKGRAEEKEPRGEIKSPFITGCMDIRVLEEILRRPNLEIDERNIRGGVRAAVDESVVELLSEFPQAKDEAIEWSLKHGSIKIYRKYESELDPTDSLRVLFENHGAIPNDKFLQFAEFLVDRGAVVPNLEIPIKKGFGVEAIRKMAASLEDKNVEGALLTSIQLGRNSISNYLVESYNLKCGDAVPAAILSFDIDTAKKLLQNGADPEYVFDVFESESIFGLEFERVREFVIGTIESVEGPIRRDRAQRALMGLMLVDREAGQRMLRVMMRPGNEEYDSVARSVIFTLRNMADADLILRDAILAGLRFDGTVCVISWRFGGFLHLMREAGAAIRFEHTYGDRFAGTYMKHKNDISMMEASGVDKYIEQPPSMPISCLR